MEINEKIQYWLEIAIDDLDSAKIMLEKKKYLQSGFYCHQAIEKITKGYFIFIKKIDPPYTHNISKLMNDCGLFITLTDDQKNLLDILMPLNIEARYPDEKKEIMRTLSSARSLEIYNRTRDMAQWIQKLIS